MLALDLTACKADHMRLLAGLLAQPNEDSLPLVDDLSVSQNWLRDAVSELRRMSLQDWQTEHQRLFFSGEMQTPCPPFESAYRDGKMDGSCTEEMQRLCDENHFDCGDLPADFLGTELRLAAQALEQANDETWEVLWKHLCQWLQYFADDLQEHAQLVFYQRLAEKLRDLVAYA